MAAQAWQHTNVNFNDVNGAMATAAGSFSKAGSLAQGLVKSINDQKLTDLKAQQTAYLLDGENRTNRLAVDANKRAVTQEANKYHLGLDRQIDTNNGLVQAADTSATTAKADYLGALNADVQAHYVPQGQEGYDNLPGETYTRPMLNEQGQPVIDPTTQQPVMQSYKVDGYTQNKFDAVPEGQQQFVRSKFIKLMSAKLMESGKYTQATADAAATAEASKRLGALATNATITGKNAALKTVVDNKTKLVQAMIKAQGKTGTVVNVNGTGGGTRTTGRNGSYSTTNTSDANDPEINAKWIKDTFSTSRGPLDALAAVFSSDTALNQNIIKKNQAEYVTDYGVTPAQYRAFMNGAVHDGVVGDEQAADKLFTGTKAEKLAIATKMKAYGHDKESTSTKVKIPNGSAASSKAALTAQYEQMKTLVTQSDKDNKAYLQDVQASYAAATPKSKQQLLANFRNHQIKLMKAQIKETPVTTKVKVGADGDKTKVKLFQGKDPISKAMHTIDPKGESSLLKLQLDSPKKFGEYVKSLNKPERAKITAYLSKPSNKSIMAKYVEARIKNKSKVTSKTVAPKTKVIQPKVVPNGSQPRVGGHGASRKYTAPKPTVYEKQPARAKMSLVEQQKIFHMTDIQVHDMPAADRVKLLQQYDLPVELTKKLAKGLY